MTKRCAPSAVRRWKNWTFTGNRVVVRPFSGIIISPLADRFGRRTVLTLSISSGSEMQSAIAFMVEHAPPNGTGLFGSFSNMASGLDEPFHRHEFVAVFGFATHSRWKCCGSAGRRRYRVLIRRRISLVTSSFRIDLSVIGPTIRAGRIVRWFSVVRR